MAEDKKKTEKKPGVFRSLFSSNSFLDKLKRNKVQIKGWFVLFVFLWLTAMTILPVFGIIFFKSLVYKKGLMGSLLYALTQCGLLLVFIPLFKWWGQSLLIHRSLKKHVEKAKEKDAEAQPPGFSVVLFARALGLLPIALFLPLKVIYLPPKDLVHHMLYPPISSAILTGVDALVKLSNFPSFAFFFGKDTVSFFLFNQQSSVYARPSFYISAFFFVVTFFLTVRKMRKVTELPASYVFSRVLLAAVVWDVLMFVGLIFLPLAK